MTTVLPLSPSRNLQIASNCCCPSSRSLTKIILNSLEVKTFSLSNKKELRWSCDLGLDQPLPSMWWNSSFSCLLAFRRAGLCRAVLPPLRSCLEGSVGRQRGRERAFG